MSVIITEKSGRYRTIYQHNKSSVGVCVTCYNDQDKRFDVVAHDRDQGMWRRIERDLTASEAYSILEALTAALDTAVPRA